MSSTMHDWYTEIGRTNSLCDYEYCDNFVPTKIIEIDGLVYYLKECPIHGVHKRLISTDYNYYTQATKKQKQTTDIGYIILEITDDCDIKCSTCIAASGPGNNEYKSISEILFLVDKCIQNVGVPELLFISGGEPTIHPDFFEILDKLISKAKRIFVISNGVKIASDVSFVQKLSRYRSNIEVYLQFDSLQSKSLLDIRGIDLKEVRLNAIKNLNQYHINMTLVCISKNSVNNTEINQIIDFALKYKYIRGVTFQPLKFLGRGNVENTEKAYITLSDIRKEILKGSIFNSDNLVPHFYNPENICIGYYDKISKQPVTVDMQENNLLQKAFFFSPQYSTDKFRYEDLFRVCIVSFFDRFSYNSCTVEQSSVYFINRDGLAIPQNKYYLFYRNK